MPEQITGPGDLEVVFVSGEDGPCREMEDKMDTRDH